MSYAVSFLSVFVEITVAPLGTGGKGEGNFPVCLTSKQKQRRFPPPLHFGSFASACERRLYAHHERGLGGGLD